MDKSPLRTSKGLTDGNSCFQSKGYRWLLMRIAPPAPQRGKGGAKQLPFRGMESPVNCSRKAAKEFRFFVGKLKLAYFPVQGDWVYVWGKSESVLALARMWFISETSDECPTYVHWQGSGAGERPKRKRTLDEEIFYSALNAREKSVRNLWAQYDLLRSERISSFLSAFVNAEGTREERIKVAMELSLPGMTVQEREIFREIAIEIQLGKEIL